MSELVIEGLRAAAAGQELLTGVDIVVRSGEVHAVMGPNGSGKSTLAHVVAGRPGYEVLGGSVQIDGVELLGLPPWQRAEAGLFLAMQYPTEVPGVALRDLLRESTRTSSDPADIDEQMKIEARRIGFDDRFLERPLNVDLSGGETKRNETLQMGVLKPAFALLDELDSGLDVDALRLVSQRVEEATHEDDMGVLAITHYSRLFEQLKPDMVHVFAGGRIQAVGGPELATELEETGYERWATADVAASAAPPGKPVHDPIAVPGDDPFADPLA